MLKRVKEDENNMKQLFILFFDLDKIELFKFTHFTLIFLSSTPKSRKPEGFLMSSRIYGNGAVTKIDC